MMKKFQKMSKRRREGTVKHGFFPSNTCYMNWEEGKGVAPILLSANPLTTGGQLLLSECRLNPAF